MSEDTAPGRRALTALLDAIPVDVEAGLVEVRRPRHRPPHRAAAIALSVVIATAGLALAAWAFGHRTRPPATRTPTLPGRIAFVDARFGPAYRADLYWIPASGGHPRLVARDAFDPTWSPDGTKLAFRDVPGFGRSVNPPGGFGPSCDGTIVVLDLGSGVVHRITGGSEPAWSPDGRRIAFVSGLGIAVMDASSRHVRKVASLRELAPCLSNQGPSWSPDGRWLVFPQAGEQGAGGLFLVRPDGTGLHQLTVCPGRVCRGAGMDLGPAWSPDGRLIAFSRQQHIFVVRPDGTNLRQLTSCTGRRNCGDTQPAWSADGAWIAFQRDRPTRAGDYSVIVVMDATGSNERVLTSQRLQACCPAWGADPV